MMIRPGDPEPLLRVEDLSVSFPALRGERTRILDRVGFQVSRSETVGLVGESGSGKTVTALSIMGLHDRHASVDGGRILLDGQDLLAMEDAAKRRWRGGRVGMIFQSPKASLNPLVKSGEQVARVVRLHRSLPKAAARKVAVDLLRSVGIVDAPRRFHSYPHQLSGGMAQRVMIAMTLAAEPELLIADEPTTGLDVTIQAQIFDLLLELQERLRMSILLITHDLALVAETCDRVVVMHGGHIVEDGPVDSVFRNPGHPYTRRLLGSILRVDRRIESSEPVTTVSSERIPYATRGCRYVGRCPLVFDRCANERPRLHPIDQTGAQQVMCHLDDPRVAGGSESGGPRAVVG